MNLLKFQINFSISAIYPDEGYGAMGLENIIKNHGAFLTLDQMDQIMKITKVNSEERSQLFSQLTELTKCYNNFSFFHEIKLTDNKIQICLAIPENNPIKINSLEDFKDFMKTIFNSEKFRNNDRYQNDVDAVKIRIKKINNTNKKVLDEILQTATILNN